MPSLARPEIISDFLFLYDSLWFKTGTARQRFGPASIGFASRVYDSAPTLPPLTLLLSATEMISV